jgi:hypothetical protein
VLRGPLTVGDIEHVERGVGKRQCTAGTADDQPKSHETGGRGDAHTRNHFGTTLQRIANAQFCEKKIVA